MALDPELCEAVERLLVAGRKIEAIKLVRVATGCGLKEAKEMIDAYCAEHPERFPVATKSGCMALVCAIIVCGALVHFCTG